jgi:hypothetical protein
MPDWTPDDPDQWPCDDDFDDCALPICTDCMERPTFDVSMCSECALRLESPALEDIR